MKFGFIIYAHTNRINSKRYVGLTKWSKGQPYDAMMCRWRGHCNNAMNGSDLLFHKAIKKYGIDVWNHEILDIVNTKESAKLAERLWIKQRCSFVIDHPELGYNLTQGGEGTLGWVPSKETRQRMSKAGKGKKKRMPPRTPDHQRKLTIAAQNRKPVSDETRKRLSIALIGNQNTKGHHLSLKHKQKLCEAFTGERNHQWRKPSSNRGKKIPHRTHACVDCGNSGHNKRTCPITHPENHLKRQVRLKQ